MERSLWTLAMERSCCRFSLAWFLGKMEAEASPCPRRRIVGVRYLMRHHGGEVGLHAWVLISFMANLGCLVSYLKGQGHQNKPSSAQFSDRIKFWLGFDQKGNSGLSTTQVNEHRVNTRGIRKITGCVSLKGQVLRKS
jgi:hypothetical protein